VTLHATHAVFACKCRNRSRRARSGGDRECSKGNQPNQRFHRVSTKGPSHLIARKPSLKRKALPYAKSEVRTRESERGWGSVLHSAFCTLPSYHHPICAR